MTKKKYSDLDLFIALMVVSLIAIALTAIWISRQAETNWGMGTINGIRHNKYGDYYIHISVYDGFEKEFAAVKAIPSEKPITDPEAFGLAQRRAMRA